MKDVVIYLTNYCPYCFKAKALLDSKGVVYTEVDVTENPEKRAEMQQLANRNTVPQIFIGNQHVGGCDDLHELDAKGELDKLLAEN